MHPLTSTPNGDVGEADLASVDDIDPPDRPSATTSRPDRIDRRTLLALFLVMFGIYGITAGGHGYSIDDEIKYQMTQSLVNLDPTIPVAFPVFPVLYRERDDGTFTSVYGIGQSVAAVPFYGVGRMLAVFAHGDGAIVALRTTTFLTNSAIGALIAVFLALLCLELGASRRGALRLAFCYGIGSYALPLMKTFGAEPGTALLVVAATWLAFKARRTERAELFAWCGVAAGLSTLFRVSAIAFVPFFGLYVLASAPRGSAPRRRLREAFAFGGGAVAGIAVLLASNWWRYGDPFDIGYTEVNATYPVIKGVVNVYLSPGKSFFLFAPIAIVALVAVVKRWRSFDLRSALILLIVAANTYTIAKLSVWSGDDAWGPRYMQLVLPLVVALCAPIVDRRFWTTAVRTAAIAGFVIGGLLGTLVAPNVFFIKAHEALGYDAVASDGFQPVYDVKVHSDLAWNQVLGNLELVPRAVRDVFGALRPGEVPRGKFSADPYTFYGFYGLDARVDFWWLWIAPEDGPIVTYLLLVPLAGSAVAGALLFRRRPRGFRDREPPAAVLS